MQLKKETQEKCEYCGDVIILHEYKGLEGRWWTEHVCPGQEDSDQSANYDYLSLD